MLLDGSLFSVFRIVPTLKSAMENGSLCQVLLNKDFFQYGCNRVHLSSSSYVVMVARIVTQKRQGLAPTSFFISSPLSLFVVQGISWYHTIFRPLLLCKKSNNGSACLLSSGGSGVLTTSCSPSPQPLNKLVNWSKNSVLAPSLIPCPHDVCSWSGLCLGGAAATTWRNKRSDGTTLIIWFLWFEDGVFPETAPAGM